MEQKPPHISNHSWQEAQLFISSTFRDMHAERDYLVRFVFPKIREELFKRRIYFVDIDLRWGLTSEDDVVGACLSIIDECHPLFLGILGGRYGWIPSHLEKPLSITEDEIEYAMQKFDDGGFQRLFFLFRDDSTTLSMEESVPGEFRELPGSEPAQKLVQLKERIRESGFDVYTYDAVWDNGTNRLTNLHEFGKLVYDYIHAYIEDTYGPLEVSSTSVFDEDDEILDLFIHQRNRFFIMKGLEKSFKKMEALTKPSQVNNVILVTGERGIGKSSFLCKFIEHSRSDNTIRMIPHFIGVTSRSSELDEMLRRLCHLLLKEINTFEPIPNELDKLILYFQRLLTSLDPNTKYVLLIDGINQLQPMNSAHELRWLPAALPQNITIIFSTADHPISDIIRLRWPSLQEIELKGLSKNGSLTLISYFLSRYQKRLTPSQIQCLLNKNGSHIPLYLSTVIEELRLYPNYEHLLEFMQSLPGETVPLLQWIINTRIALSNEFIDQSGQRISESLVRRYLSYIYISQQGLSESELEEILGNLSVHGNVAALTRQLRSFLMLRGELLTFYHEDIRTAVYNSFILSSSLDELHEELAAYFHRKADPEGSNTWQAQSLRYFEQLLYHQLQINDRKALAEFISSGFLEAYAKRGTHIDLLRDIRNIVIYLTSDPNTEYWEATLHCMNVFAALSSSIMNKTFHIPHPLERALAEGRDEDVTAFLENFSHGSKAAAARCAVSNLYEEMGQMSKAQAIEAITLDEEQLKKTPLPFQLLYCSLNSPQQKAEQDLLKEESTFPKSIDEPQKRISLPNKPVKPKLRIPGWQIFSLTAIGRFRLFFAIIIGLLAFIGVLHMVSPLYDALNHIKLWAKSYSILGQGVVIAATILFGIPVLIVPFVLTMFLNYFFTILLKKRSRTQIQSLASAIGNLPSDKRQIPLMGLARYIRLLKEANISEYYWDIPPAADLAKDEILHHIHLGEYNHAGLLVACFMNSGSQLRSSLIDALSKLPSDTLYEIILTMLHHKSILRNPRDVFDVVLRIYRSIPPVPIVLEVLELQKSSDEDYIRQYLEQTDKSILTRCLLRSMDSRSETLMPRLLEKCKLFLQRLFVSEPVPFSWYELVITLPFVAGFLATVCFISFLGYSLILGGLMFGLAPYLLWNICRQWRSIEQIPVAIRDYKELLLKKATASGISNKQQDVLSGTFAVETALIQLLQDNKIKPKVIFQHFSDRVIIQVWSCLLRPGFSPRRDKLLSALLDASDILPHLLKKVSLQKAYNDPPDKAAHHRQWIHMRANHSPWISGLQLTMLSLSICSVSIGILFVLSEPWLALFLEQRGWIMFLLVLFAYFIPFSRLRYLAITLPLFILLLPDNWFLLTKESFFYIWIPMLSMVTAYYTLSKWHCSCCLYPTQGQVIFTKFKAVMLSFIGSVVICSSFIFLIYIGTFMNNDITDLPEKSPVNALMNYSAIKRWPDSPSSLYSHTLWEQINKPWDISITQAKLYKRVDQGDQIYETSLALKNFGYYKEAAECQQKALQYLGWYNTRTALSTDNKKTELTDINGNPVAIAIVVTYISPASQAESLGIELGDILLSIDGKSIHHLEDVSEFMSPSQDKTMRNIPITVKRDHSLIKLLAQPGKLGIHFGAINMDYLS